MTIRGGVIRQLQEVLDAGSLGALDDADLLGRFARGDAGSGAAFEALVARHGRMVHRVCLGVLGDSHEAQDAAQAAFLVLSRRAPAIRKPEALTSWLHGTARRIAARTLRASIRRERHERRKARAEATDPGPAPARDWSDLHDELARLPARYRDPIVLCDLAGLSHDQAAGRIGAPVRTLETRLYRGREQLKARLIRRGLAPSAALVAMAAEAGAAPLPTGWPAETARLAVEIAKKIRAAAGTSPAAWSMARVDLKEILMIKLKAIAAVGILAGLAAGGTWTLGAGDGPNPVAVPLAEPARLARTPSPVPGDEFERLYVLADGEDLKVLHGPAIEARFEHYEGRTNEVGFTSRQPGDFRLTPKTIYFRWRDGARSWEGTTSAPGGTELRQILGQVLKFDKQQVEGDLALLDTPIFADLLIRVGVPPEQLAPKLEAILRSGFHLPVRIRFGEEMRDVIVVRGRYHHTPDPSRDDEAERAEPGQVQVYAREIDPPQVRSWSGSGYSLDGFLSEVALQFGVRFLNEVEEAPKATLAWKLSGPKPPATIPVEDQAPTLDHVAQQTGLTFAKESRKVRFLRVDREE